MHSSTLDLLLGIGLTALLGLMGWLARVLIGLTKTVAKLDQHLFGPGGNNGMTAQVKSLDVRVGGVEDRVIRLEERSL